MLLHSPIFISARLLPAVRIGDVTISIGYSARSGRDGRTRYEWFIDGLDNEHTGDDLQSGCCGGGLQSGLESLLSFLGACGESWSYDGEAGENSDLFPPEVAEWCAANTDELAMLGVELEETPDLIDE